MEKEFSNGQMAEYIKDNFMMIKNMAMENSNGLIQEFIKENLKTISKMEKVDTKINMGNG